MQGLSVLNSISRLELCAGPVPARGNVRTWEGASVAEGVFWDEWKLFSHKDETGPSSFNRLLGVRGKYSPIITVPITE